jgi:acid phosphatase
MALSSFAMYSSSLLLSPAFMATGALSHSPNSYHFDPLHRLAGVAPPFDPALPQGCNIARAAYLDGHAAIHANDFDYEQDVVPFVQKISNTMVNWSKISVLSFSRHGRI